MKKREDEKRLSSCKRTEDVAERLHPLCDGCPYGRAHEFCFLCWKYLLGQEGYH